MLDSPTLQVHLLGRFHVVVGQQAIPSSSWRLRTAAALVKLLALAPNYRLHREALMDTLWPEAEPEVAARNLRYSLHAARRILGQGQPTAFLQREGEMLTLGPSDLIWVDATAFEQAAAEAREVADPAIAQRALSLYVGDLLPDDLYDDWLAARRTALRDTCLGLLHRLAERYEESGELPAAIEALQRLVSVEPADEGAHAGLMRLYALTGQKHLAVAQFERLQAILDQELGAEPEPATRDLLAAIQEGRLPSIAPPPPSRPAGTDPPPAPTIPSGVPSLLNTLLGREEEIAAIARSLATARLVTLTGVGGIGKTRLALAVASALADTFADGSVFVPLASVRDPHLVMSAIGQAIHVGDHGGQALVDLVTTRLSGKQLLLVLDNFEQLLEFGPALATLLGRCPRLTVLVTSRARLQLSGEQEYPVPPLRHPDASAPALPATLAEYPAVELFVRRAREVRPAFELTTDNAPAVAEICRRLDGLPLAIELAAARSKLLSPQEILARIDAPLTLLTGGPRDAPERQRTMRDAIGWSYDLLTPEEQRLFHRLSIFAGGSSLEAAETVAGADGLATHQFLDLLGSLVDKSLVLQQTSPAGESRIGLYEPIREFGLERLDALDELDLLRERHAEYFAALAEPTTTRLEGPEPGRWLDRLDLEIDNVRGALRWAIAARRADLAQHLAGAYWEFWCIRGYMGEGRHWLDAALALPGAPENAARAEAFRGAGEVALRQGEVDTGARFLGAALGLFRRLGHEFGIARTLNSFGLLEMVREDLDQARACFQEALEISKRMGDVHFAGRLQQNLAGSMVLQGNYDEARRLLEDLVRQYRGSGNLRILAYASRNLGVIAHDQGDYEQSRIWKEESLELFQRQGDRLGEANLICSLGQWALAIGDYDLAQRRFEESIFLSRETGSRPQIASALRLFGELALARDEPLRAARLFGAAEALRETVHWDKPSPAARAGYQQALDRLRVSLGEAALADGWLDGRRMPLDQAITYALHAPDPATVRAAESRV